MQAHNDTKGTYYNTDVYINHMSRPESAVIRAEHELRMLVRTALRSGNPLLPPLRELTQRLEVSRATVIKAMQRMQRAGLVVSVPSRGYAAVGPAPPDSPAPSKPCPEALSLPCPRWQDLAQTIEQDILEGRFPVGTTLPSIKELCAQYGSGRHSLLRALRLLSDQGRLRRHGRRSEVIGALPPRPTATLVFACISSDAARFSTLTPHSAELWRNLERESHRRGLALAVREFSAIGASHDIEAATVVGYIISTLTTRPSVRNDAIRAALSTRTAVALLDETGDGAELLRGHTSPLLRRFSMGTSMRCGRQVGEYLLARGHRRVVFIAHDDEYLEGARRRWSGIRQPFERVGLPDAVVFRALEKRGTEELASDEQLTMVRTRFRRTLTRLAGKHDRTWVESATADMSRLAAEALTRGRTHKLFERLQRTEQATAWVAYNDHLALLALDYLRHAGVRLPRDLSLVGFDDTLAGLGKGLSSYSFNIHTIVNAILEHVLAPRRTGSRSSIVEIPGMVMVRQTSGRANVK